MSGLRPETFSVHHSEQMAQIMGTSNHAGFGRTDLESVFERGRYRAHVTTADWSPADHPHAAALSEANAWKRAVDLCAERLHAGGLDDQTDARLFLLALRLLLRAQSMASDAVRASPAAAQITDNARRQFDRVCPGAKDACDVIEHFAEYALGRGHRQPGGNFRQADRPIDRVAAAQDWPLRYDRTADRILLGPVGVEVAVVCDQAKRLVHAIWASVRAFEDGLLEVPDSGSETGAGV